MTYGWAEGGVLRDNLGHVDGVVVVGGRGTGDERSRGSSNGETHLDGIKWLGFDEKVEEVLKGSNWALVRSECNR